MTTAAVAATTMEITTMKCPAMDTTVKTATVMKEAAPDTDPHRETVPVIRIGIAVAIGRVVLIIPSIVGLTILSVVRIIAVNGSRGL
jgi:hypothetical protein